MLNHTPKGNLGSVIAEGVMRAAAEILRERGMSTSDVDVVKMCEALRREAKAALPRIIEQGKDLLGTGGSGWLEKMVAVECVEAARIAVDEVIG